MKELLQIREQFGSSFVTQFADGTIIPWKCLSIGEFLEYERLIASRKYPPAIIEDEIFRKCVLNRYLAEHPDKLKAGTITTVIENILAASVPHTTEEIDTLLNINRQKVSGVIHDLVCIICQAFPAYKPDDIYAMDTELFMERLALAERKLLSTGIMTAPLQFSQEGTPAQKVKPVIQKPNLPMQDTARKFKEQQDHKPLVITKKDRQEQQDLAYTGHEKEDKMVKEQEMLANTVPVYQEYMEQMKSGGKVVIKSPEERKAAAIERAKENEKKYKEMLAQKKKQEEENLKQLAQARKIQRTVKKK